MGAVRVGVVGVGNCAASLVQGVHYYRDAAVEDRVPGLMHVKFGDYHVADIQFVTAFDVDAKKVGLDLAEAIGASENKTIKFADVAPLGVRVLRGPTLDGLGEYYRESITEANEGSVDVVAALREYQVDVLVSYLPVGSEQADKQFAQCAIDVGVGFVNALPVFIASEPIWARKFSDAGVPIVGDDLKSQVGATITHRVLAKLFEDRGVKLERTYQLNFSGNMDFKNMLEGSRLNSKKISKTQAVPPDPARNVRRRYPHRSKQFRPIPRRPEACLGPTRGARLRHYRRTPRVRDRHGPWHGRPGSQAELLSHEKPTRAVRRFNRTRGGRAVSSRLSLASTPLKGSVTFAQGPFLASLHRRPQQFYRGSQKLRCHTACSSVSSAFCIFSEFRNIQNGTWGP
jgi:myo-inositol-1-phosphate synthase